MNEQQFRSLCIPATSTVRDALEERLGPLLPALEALLAERGQSLAELGAPVALPRSDLPG